MIERAEGIVKMMGDKAKEIVVTRVINGVEKTYDWLTKQADADRLKQEVKERHFDNSNH